MTTEKKKVSLEQGVFDYYQPKSRIHGDPCSFTVFDNSNITLKQTRRGIVVLYCGREIMGLWDYELVTPKNEVVINAKCGQKFYSMLDGAIDKTQEIDNVLIRGKKYVLQK